MLDVAVIGCGIVGANVAYLLSQHKLRAAVFEKENDVSMGTTRANSAIVHAGYDPEPGTAMARLNVRGSALTKEQCAAFDVKYRQIGSLVLAFSDEEMARRKANWTPNEPKVKTGYLKRYSKLVSSAIQGAVMLDD